MTGRSGLSSAPALQLRPATPHDADRLLAWRNRPEIVALGTLLRTVDPAEHAAWTTLCLLILNLDETLSKE